MLPLLQCHLCLSRKLNHHVIRRVVVNSLLLFHCCCCCVAGEALPAASSEVVPTSQDAITDLTVPTARQSLGASATDHTSSGRSENGNSSVPLDCRDCHWDNYFINEIFLKYGSRSGILTFEALAELLRNLGLPQRAKSKEKSDSDHFSDHVHRHDDDHSETRKIRKRQVSVVADSTEDVEHFHGEEDEKNFLAEEKPCLSADELLSAAHIHSSEGISEHSFIHLCPVLIYEIDVAKCRETGKDVHRHHEITGDSIADIPISVWGFAALAVLVISLCGLLGVAIVPVLHRAFYNHLLQFLVALAVGSLSGDALLHLLPHALGIHTRSGGYVDEHRVFRSEFDFVWKGTAALGGIFAFFVIEQMLQIYSGHRQEKQNKNKLYEVEKTVTDGDDNDVTSELVGSKLCHHHSASREEVSSIHHCEQDRSFELQGSGTKPCPSTELKLYGLEEQAKDRLTSPGMANGKSRNRSNDRSRFDHGDAAHVHEHGHSSSGHSHGYGRGHSSGHSHGISYGHSHGPNHLSGDKGPHSMPSIAVMVIMGDGLHNLCDGIAIGAAFVNSIAGGLSTAIAVFCHELPHELGDFALLIKTGMTIKQAMFYNLVSSVLCFFGMLIGVALGNITSASMWVFAVTAGTFLYISFVDMLPEIRICGTQYGWSKCLQLVCQSLGIGTGIAIMATIAIYENDLMELVE